jgi:Nif-specific regulatory protein
MPDDPVRLISQRYEVVRPLGEGGTGSVLLVRDLHQGRRTVALKLLRAEAVDPESVARFKDEFRSMTRLRHPNLAEVYDFGTLAETGQHYLTMEYVEGHDLTSLRWPVVRDRFDDLVVQCLRALDYIHSRGFLHNDIKPHNVLIRPSSQVKVVDFGLAQRQADPAQPGLSGTIHYIAPERFRSTMLDARSDLYSLGVVLYELLTGALPYDGADAGRLVTAILGGRPRPARAVNPEIPERMETFVRALMAHDPADRPASASAALDLLNAGGARPQRLDTPETYASYVTSGRFVGRDRDLDDLLSLATAHAAAPPDDDTRPRLVAVRGPSGIGKSSLLRELKHRLQLAGTRILSGRCFEEGGVPFQPFVEVLRQLPDPAGLPAGLRPIIDQVLPPSAESDAATEGAGGASPEASATAGRGRAAGPQIDRDELNSGLAQSLDWLAQGVPGVIVLEDMHWSDSPSVDLLEHLILRKIRGPWLVIASLRDEEGRTAPVGALLERHADSARLRRIDLKPLDLDQVTEFIASMLPFSESPSGLARILVERTEGNPLYLEELMKSLAEEGGLRRSGAAWLAEEGPLRAIRLPPSLAGAVAKRLGGLAPAERAVVEALSVFNRPVDAGLLATALGTTAAAIGGSIEGLDRLRLVALETERGGAPLVRLSHSRIRDTAYTAIDTDRRGPLHLAVGTAIEESHRSSTHEVVEELAHHFAAAGDRERGPQYCLRAAENATAIFDYRRGVDHLTRALALLPLEKAEPRLEALYGIANVMTNELGDYDGGYRHARQLEEEAGRAGNAIRLASGLRLQALSLAFGGKEEGAVEIARRAVDTARPTGHRAEIVSCLNYLGIVLARRGEDRKALPFFEEANALSEAAQDVHSLVMGLNNLALCHLGLGEPSTSLKLWERFIQVTREHGLTYAYHHFSPNVHMARVETGDLLAAIPILEEGLAWSRDHANFETAGHHLSSLSQLHAMRGLFDKALGAVEEVRGLRRQTGDAAGQIILVDYLGNVHREVGRLERAEATHREGLDLARSLHSRMQEGFLLASLAADLLEMDRLDDARDVAREALALGQEIDHDQITFHAWCVRALIAAKRRDRKAIATATRRIAGLDTRPLRYPSRLQMHLVLGRCSLAVGRPADAEREARSGLEAARGGFREFEWKLQALLGEALAGRGLPEQSADAYNAALAVIRQIASDIEDPVMREDYEKDPRRQEVVRKAAESGVRPMPAAFPVVDARDAPVRMLATIYEITQIINSILDLKELLNKVMDLAIDIVAAERGLIFLYRSETDEMEMVVGRNIEHQTIKDATEYSRSILKEAGRGRAILSHDASADARFRQYASVTLYSIRSLLCVPLKIRNGIIGTVYVDTRKPGVVFSEDDLKFLEAFANQAAIAIENARLYEQVRQENQYLRRAVQERYGYENIIGRSPRMREVFTLLSRVATSSLPVMIRGESGTGKELVARAVHHNSTRRDRKFFSENCAALPDTLLESELFGHVKGAFTGADATRRGLFELADGGTLFLDEIGDMSMSLQSKLLRVLQDGELRPLGSEETRRVDVRVISATNRDLEAMTKQKTFREDLYFRLKVITVKLPPLRDRREDIPLLVDHFLGRIARENKAPKLRVDPALTSVLTRYDWPGNVRELENQIYKLALFTSGDTLSLEDARNDDEFVRAFHPPGAKGVETGITREDLERALSESQGNRDAAARHLGISRATMFRKLKQFEIEPKRAPRPSRRPHTA